MRLGRRPNQQDEAQVDLTSMLDIVFIMLIFFIVTSSFVRESGVEVNRPQASNVVSQKDAGIFIAVTAANDVTSTNEWLILSVLRPLLSTCYLISLMLR